MAASKYLTAPVPSPNLPTGIPYIVGNEAAERFSFYGMKTILFIFMTKYMMDAFDGTTAKIWVHNFTFAVYFFPIIGAIVSDWLFGKYNTIMWLSLVYCAGHAVLACLEVESPFAESEILWFGLALIAVGAGGIKPCVSAHVGDQFGKENEHLLSRIFGWFYFSINLGSTVSTLLTPLLLKHFGPAWAFGVPGILMGIATLTFWLGRNKFVHIPASGSKLFEETFSPQGRRAIVNLIPLYFFVAMFWALFDQTASAWVQQAEHMDKEFTFLGMSVELLSSQLQAANPILVMLLIPVFSYGLYPFLGRFFEVTPLRKIGIGLFVTIPAFALPAWLESRIQAGETPHIVWQLLAYAIMTAAEVMVSITALEFSYTQAPKKMKSFIMGLYLLSVAFGNLFTAQVNEYISRHKYAMGPNGGFVVDVGEEEYRAEVVFEKEPKSLDVYFLESETDKAVLAKNKTIVITGLKNKEGDQLKNIVLQRDPKTSSTQGSSHFHISADGLKDLKDESLLMGGKMKVSIDSRDYQVTIKKRAGVKWLDGANYYWFFTAAIAITACLFTVFARFYRGQTFIQGDEAPQEVQPCPMCGAEIPVGANECPRCGEALDANTPRE